MNRRIGLHALFRLAYWFVYAYTYSRYDGNFGKYALSEALQMPARMLATYASIWLLEHGTRGNVWRTFSGVALVNIAGGMLNRLIKGWYVVPALHPESTFSYWNFGKMMVDIFDVVLATGVALTARLYFRQQELLRREEALRQEKLAAELHALRSQLHPHFLFNTINNLYALARLRSERTAPVALQLANLLRFVLYETRKPAIAIEQEVRILRDYLELEKLRFDDDRLEVRATFELDEPDTPIAPLLLLPFVENAFKHGAGEQDASAWVHLDVALRDGLLSVVCENSRPAGLALNSDGIGLANVRRQLELVYPDAHRLEIKAGESEFNVLLEIRLAPGKSDTIVKKVKKEVIA
jgi:two-component system LytT family sensor kinase